MHMFLRLMPRITIFYAAFAVFAGMAFFANVAGAEPETDTQQTSVEKMDLARQYYELNPTWKMVSAAIRNRAKDMPPKQRLVFVTAMEKMIDKQQLREEAIPVIADLFSVEELETLIKFYENPHIQTALAKKETFERRIAPTVTRMIDKAFLEYRTRGDKAPDPVYP